MDKYHGLFRGGFGGSNCLTRKKWPEQQSWFLETSGNPDTLAPTGISTVGGLLQSIVSLETWFTDLQSGIIYFEIENHSL